MTLQYFSFDCNHGWCECSCGAIVGRWLAGTQPSSSLSRQIQQSFFQGQSLGWNYFSVMEAILVTHRWAELKWRTLTWVAFFWLHIKYFFCEITVLVSVALSVKKWLISQYWDCYCRVKCFDSFSFISHWFYSQLLWTIVLCRKLVLLHIHIVHNVLKNNWLTGVTLINYCPLVSWGELPRDSLNKESPTYQMWKINTLGPNFCRWQNISLW